jgi:hypothetical protein
MSTTSVEPACDLDGRRIDSHPIKRNGRVILQAPSTQEGNANSEVQELVKRDILKVVNQKIEEASRRLTRLQLEALRVFMRETQTLREGDSSHGRSARAATARILRIKQKTSDERLFRAFAKLTGEKYEEICRRVKLPRFKAQ